MIHSRRGFTLIELAVVMAILSVVATVVVTTLGLDLGRTHPRQTAAELLTLLSRARSMAIDSNVNVAMVFDPASGDYRIDTIGASGAGLAEMGNLDLGAMESMTTDAALLRYFFQPTGAALGDTVRVQGPDSSMIVYVDPWDGKARAGNGSN